MILLREDETGFRWLAMEEEELVLEGDLVEGLLPFTDGFAAIKRRAERLPRFWKCARKVNVTRKS